MLLQERFRVRDEKVKNLGSKTRDRQEKVKSGYLKALEEYLSLVNSIPDSGEVSPALLISWKNSSIASFMKRNIPSSAAFLINI